MTAAQIERQLAYMRVEGELIAKLDADTAGSPANVEIVNIISYLRAARGADSTHF